MTTGDVMHTVEEAPVSSAVLFAAHELKSPVALIRQLSLELASVASDSQAAQKIINQITIISERALRLTSDLTRSSQLDPSLFPCEPVNAVELCEDIAHELSPMYNAHGRDIRVNKRRRSSLVVANRDLLRRILLGFGDNALHYAQDTPFFTVTQKHDRIAIGLRDYGPILPTQTWRAVKNRSRTMQLTGRPEASGLGLVIAQEFAHAMNADIGVRRHQDGQTFYVTLLPSVQLSLL